MGVEGKYFRGGYITRRWGSLHGGNIDCIQLEVPQWVRDDSEVYGEMLGRAFAKWVQNHYQCLGHRSNTPNIFYYTSVNNYSC